MTSLFRVEKKLFQAAAFVLAEYCEFYSMVLIVDWAGAKLHLQITLVQFRKDMYHLNMIGATLAFVILPC